MKYLICAKILGSFFPEEGSFKIGRCTIRKDNYIFDRGLDTPEVPTRNRSSEHHVLSKGVKNFIVFSQSPPPTRTFESEYVMTIEIEESSLHHALREAEEIFVDTINSLSLAVKTTVVRIGSHKHFRDDELYDFEILSAYLKRGREMMRLKLPTLTSGRNFFPKKPPKDFLSKARKYYKFQTQDPVFAKAMIYLHRATANDYHGRVDGIEKVLNFIKCIELISDSLGQEGRLGSRRKYKDTEKKECFRLAGKFLKVGTKHIKNAQQAWDARNKGDIAHQLPYYNYYNKYSHFAATLFNYQPVEAAASVFLTKYYRYKVSEF